MKNFLFDHHTHIGQFYNTYYEPHTVIEVMSECGASGCLFSSTTSCLAWNNETEKKTIVSHIRDEVSEALETAERLWQMNVTTLDLKFTLVLIIGICKTSAFVS